MTAKHTPGPWTIVDPEAGGWCVQSRDMTSKARNGGFVSAVCPGPDGPANARLIAAAPDMLAALERLEAVREPGDEIAALEQARAAIAKAKGA